MAVELISTPSPNEEGNQNASNHNTPNKGGYHSIEEIAPPHQNGIIKTKFIWLFFGLLDAGVTLLFWGYSEFFDIHNSPILSSICFAGFTFSLLAAIAGYAFKIWPHIWIICFAYFISCILFGTLICRYSAHSPKSATELNTPPNPGNSDLSISIPAKGKVNIVAKNSIIELDSTPSILIGVANDGITTSHITISFETPLPSSDLGFSLSWRPNSHRRVGNAIWNNWVFISNDVLPHGEAIMYDEILISPKLSTHSFPAIISISSDNTRVEEFPVTFIWK